MPKIIDFEVYVKVSELESLGVPKRTIYNNISSKNVEVYKHEEHGKLISFKSMQWAWRKKVNDFFGGCVKEYTQIMSIENAILPYCPNKDKNVLMSYRLVNGAHLPNRHVKAYEQKCRVLHLLSSINPLTDGRVRQFGVLNIKEFWQVLYKYIAKHSINLPKSKRLYNLFKQYLQEGAMAVISKKFSNSGGAILKELQIDLIVELYADRDGRKFTRKEVWRQFKAIAKEKGWKRCETVSYQRIAQVLAKTRGEWHLERHGEKDFKLHQTLIINRRKLSGRNLVWQLDGTPECLWYYDDKRKTIDKLYVMKVMDSRTWKIVGYSIGYTETSNLVFEAVKMGCTVLGVKPREVRSDKGSAMQAAETKELMENLGATFYPTATGMARAKSIEAWQALFNQQVLVYFKNKSGANITAKSLDSRQNPDKLKKFAKSYPTKSELVKQIRLAMELWNCTENSKGITPNKAYEKCEEKGNELGMFERFSLFSIWRKKGAKLQKYRFKAQGLEIEISGNKYRYLPELPPSELANFMNKHTDVTDFYVKYDPSDLSQVSMYLLPISKEETTGNMQMICEAKAKGYTSESYKDANDNEKALLIKMRAAQKQQVSQAKSVTEKRREILQSKNIMNGAIELERVHKDKLNDAQIALERLEVLGYDDTIQTDVNKELSSVSMIEDSQVLEDEDWLFKDDKNNDVDDDFNVYGLPNQ